MAEQQPQSMQQEAELQNVAQEISGVQTPIGAQGVAKIITSYQGDPKQCKERLKSVQKYAILLQLSGHIRQDCRLEQSNGYWNQGPSRWYQRTSGNAMSPSMYRPMGGVKP